jgi:hypothetical protein
MDLKLLLKVYVFVFIYNNDVYYRFNIYTNYLYIHNLEMSLFNINIKKNRIDNQYSSYLWYCKLGHINETRITKLYKEWYFDAFDYESHEICLFYMMTKTLFTRKNERSKKLLGLIHIYVCGPMMIHT